MKRTIVGSVVLLILTLLLNSCWWMIFDWSSCGGDIEEVKFSETSFRIVNKTEDMIWVQFSYSPFSSFYKGTGMNIVDIPINDTIVVWEYSSQVDAEGYLWGDIYKSDNEYVRVIKQKNLSSIVYQPNDEGRNIFIDSLWERDRILRKNEDRSDYIKIFVITEDDFENIVEEKE